jgi:hypothetical protein
MAESKEIPLAIGPNREPCIKSTQTTTFQRMQGAGGRRYRHFDAWNV